MKESTLAVEKDEVQATPGSATKLIHEVTYKTRKRVSSEDKIRIVLEGFRKEFPTSDLCRRENISTALYYSWLKDFMEAGKARSQGDSLRTYVLDLQESLMKGTILERKCFIRTFVKQISIDYPNLELEYTIPLPIPNKETSSKEEVLCMQQIGSPNRV